MRLNELCDNNGAKAQKKRKGRGIGSGKGKTATRGQKGQKARSGSSMDGFQGGQTPLEKRLPKRGMRGGIIRKVGEQGVSLDKIAKAVADGKIDPLQIIDTEFLRDWGYLRKNKIAKLIGGTSSGISERIGGITFKVEGVSQAARNRILESGARLELTRNVFTFHEEIPFLKKGRVFLLCQFDIKIDDEKMSFEAYSQKKEESSSLPMNTKITFFETDGAFEKIDIDLTAMSQSREICNLDMDLVQPKALYRIFYKVDMNGENVLFGEIGG